MKKFGFTLVEVLMTLGIIGVVGMLVTPSIMENGRNQTNAARLSTAVSNFENGIQTGMAAENAEDLYNWDVWTDAPVVQNPTKAQLDAFYGNITRFMTLSGYEERRDLTGYYGNNPPAMMDTDGTRGIVIEDGDIGVYTALTAKNGAMYFISDKVNDARNGESDEATARANGRTMYSRAADIIIDVNGTTRPNIFGRDIFMFALSSEGTLFPYGSQEVHMYYGEDGVFPYWNDAGGCRDGAIGDSITCTARVVENGYTIDY